MNRSSNSNDPLELSRKTVKVIRKFVAQTFNIPFTAIPRIIFHGILLACIISGFWLLDSLKDPILANTIGIEYQPTAKLLSVFTTLFVVCIYDFLTSVVSKPALFHIISLVFGMIMIILSALLSQPQYGYGNGDTNPSNILGWVAYFSIEAYGSLMVALFWSFTNSIMDLEQAKGAYGLIIAIAQVGAILGSTLATSSKYIGIPSLFVAGSMLIFSVSLLVKVYHIVFRDYATQHLRSSRVRSESENSTFDPLLPTTHITATTTSTTDNKTNTDTVNIVHPTSSTFSIESHPTIVKTDESSEDYVKHCFKSVIKVFGGFYEGLALILKYPYVLKLLGVACIYEIVVTILDYEFKLMAASESSHGDHVVAEVATDKFANLLGHFGQVTNMISFCVSLFGFSYLVHHLGVKLSLMIFPLTLFIAVIVSYLVPSLWVLFFFVSLLKGMIFSLHDPVKELLYIPTSDSIKFKAKAWIDVFGSRLAKAAGSLVTSFAFGSTHRLRQIGEIPAIVLTVIIICITWSIGDDFQYLVESNKVVGDEGAHIHSEVDMEGPIINGLRPGDIGYQGYNLELFEGVFDSEEDEFEGENPVFHSVRTAPVSTKEPQLLEEFSVVFDAAMEDISIASPSRTRTRSAHI